MVRKVKSIELIIREFEENQFVLSIEQGKEVRGYIVICSGEKEEVCSFAESVYGALLVLGFEVKRKEEKL